MDHIFDACPFQHRESFVSKFNAVGDLVKVIGQQFQPEIPACAIHSPRAAGLFVKPDAQPAPFLPQIAFACGVHDMRVFAAQFINFGNILGHKILMFHRMQREIDAGHFADFACPKPGGVHHMLGVNCAFVRHHIPCAVRALIGLAHHTMRLDNRPTHPGCLGIGVGRAGGVQMPIERVIQGADNPIQIGDRADRANFIRPQNLGIQAHVAVFGAFGDQHLEPVLIVGQGDATDMVQATGHAGKCL